MQSGEILRVREIVALGCAAVGKTVRTLGQLEMYDPSSSRAVLKMDDNSLNVDTKLLEPCPFQRKALYQIIGQIESAGSGKRGGEAGKFDTVLLKARVYRQMNDLDVKVYYECLEARRNNGKVAQELTEITRPGK